jgi:hypothetical protein
VKDGYREVEVVEDVVVAVDNSRTRLMLPNLLSTAKIEGADFGRSSITFSGAEIVYMANGVIQKEIRSVSGKISLGKSNRLEMNFVLNNVAGELNIVFGEEMENETFDLRLSSELSDEVTLEYIGNNILMEKFDDVVANCKFQIKTSGLNSFLQWILPANSKYQYFVDYKKSIKFAMEAEKNRSAYRMKNFNINSEDIDANGNFSYLESGNELEVNVNNLDLNGVTLNMSKSKTTIDQDRISIFKIMNSDELFKIIRDSGKGNSRNSLVKIGIKNLKKDSISLTNSVFDFEIIDGSYKINNFTLNLNDMEVLVENQREIGGFFVSDLTMRGKNFDNIAYFFNVPNVLGLKEFSVKSKVFVHSSTVYLTDCEAGDEKTKITGLVEYSLGEDSGYLAYRANIDDLTLNTRSNEDVMTIKEKFLWLNNFTKNVFAELHIGKLTYSEKWNATNIRTRVNYSPGYINLYNIENVNFGTMEKASGRILLDIRGKSPVVGIDLRVDRVKMRGNLVNQVFDVEKYKNLILKEPINQENQSKYWVNRLFSIPKFDEINGRINIIIGNILVNSAQLSDLSFSSTMDNGVFAIRNFKFSGLGGMTELRGILDLKGSKVINLVLTETTYNIEEIIRLFTESNIDENPDLKGTIGIGGLLKGGGPSESVFDASLDMQFKFVGKSLFIKRIGLDDLRRKLSRVHMDRSLLKMNVQKVLLENSGTTFSDFNGLFTIKGGICDLTADAKGEGTSTKLVLRIDNRNKDTTIDALNTSVIMNRIGKIDVPLYLVVKFTENFAHRAQLEINTEQIDKYLEEIRRISK